MDKARLAPFCLAMDHLAATLTALEELTEDGRNPPGLVVRMLTQRAFRLHWVAFGMAQDNAYTIAKAAEELERLDADETAEVGG